MAQPSICAKRLEINGVVQGVGFRPFLFGLAKTHGLLGQVSNTACGVNLIIQGLPGAIEAFTRDLTLKKPVLSQIKTIESVPEPVRDLTRFEIVKSTTSKTRSTLISPDVSVCDECLAEMNDPGDPRFEYPFINCTNCGPRYTIIRDVPYDRPKTSMAAFVMCPSCQVEYDNPLDRRFHAQPNACPLCGPQVFLTDNRGQRLDNNSGHALDLAAQLLDQGKILAVKGLGGFHLAVNAADETAVSLLRKRKHRPDKPFAIMAASKSSLFDHVYIDEQEQDLLTSFNRPIVLLEKKEAGSIRGLAPSLAPNNTCLGIMLPYTPLHYLLLAKGPDILVMTSGNRSGTPLSIDNEDALDAFSHIADYFLFHDRDIYFRADDSIARVQQGKQRFLRRSRGYAPLPVDLKPFSGVSLPQVLGCGAGLKSTICLTRDQYGFLSQHIGDLENPGVHEFYGQTITHMEKILDIDPQIVAHDLHPGYFSTQFAKSLGENGIPLIGVQHHHAHALSCMAENHVAGPVIALTLDGTGYGTDGHIWGGEILVCTYGEFQRRARLSYLPMPGGDTAVLEPWRMAAALLYKSFGAGFLDLDIPYVRAMDTKKLRFLVQMMEKQVNTPLTSSAGRLFDGVSSLLGLCHKISHESQAAMALETAALDVNNLVPYSFDIRGDYGLGTENCMVLDLFQAVQEMVKDIQGHQQTSHISAKFHTTLVKAFVQGADRIRQDTGIKDIVLSGGVFNNNRILSQTMSDLEKNGFKVYTHTQVPCGDGGIALGQAMAAAAEIEKISSKTKEL